MDAGSRLRRAPSVYHVPQFEPKRKVVMAGLGTGSSLHDSVCRITSRSCTLTPCSRSPSSAGLDASSSCTSTVCRIASHSLSQNAKTAGLDAQSSLRDAFCRIAKRRASQTASAWCSRYLKANSDGEKLRASNKAHAIPKYLLVQTVSLTHPGAATSPGCLQGRSRTSPRSSCTSISAALA